MSLSWYGAPAARGASERCAAPPSAIVPTVQASFYEPSFPHASRLLQAGFEVQKMRSWMGGTKDRFRCERRFTATAQPL